MFRIQIFDESLNRWVDLVTGLTHEEAIRCFNEYRDFFDDRFRII